jgi:hypothetical protein
MIFLVIWRVMAGFTVGQSIVAEVCIAPSVGIVALGALAWEMATRR